MPRSAGVVDDRLDADGLAFLQVLLDAALLVVEVDLDVGADAENAGPKDAGSVLANLAGEDGGHFVGAADADVVGDQGLEERACPAGVVEDKGAGDLDLAHGELPPVTSFVIGLGKGCWDDGEPAVEERLDILGSEVIADRLEAFGLLTGGEAVGQYVLTRRSVLANAKFTAPGLVAWLKPVKTHWISWAMTMATTPGSFA